MIGIYKITNNINNKCYIGQSINIDRRWKDHRNKNKWKDYPIYRAFKKYGLESFTFEVLEECKEEDLNRLERYYILKFSSFNRNFGYNLTKGGDSNVTFEKDSIYNEIKSLLKTTSLSQELIGERVGTSQRIVSYVNTGEIAHSANEKYPIREINILKKEHTCRTCGESISKKASLCNKCYKENTRRVLRPSPKELEKELIETNFTQVGKKYGVSDNTIRKWCKSYGMSTKAKDYKSPIGVIG